MKIPVSFNHKGKEYQGFLSRVSGAGTHLYHLMIDRRYYGQLSFNESTSQGRFTTQTGELDYLQDYFVDVLIAWYDGFPPEG